MGHTRKCTYALKLSCINFQTKRLEWHTFGLMAKDIKPTEKSVKQWRDKMNKSIMNGVNNHINHLQSLYSNAFLIDQRTNQTLVAYQAPMFEVIN